MLPLLTCASAGSRLWGQFAPCLVFSSDLESWHLVSEEAWATERCVFPCPRSLTVPSLLLCTGGTCQSPALPALVRPPAPPLQPSLDIKPFLPFPLDTAAAVNLFPNFNAVSPTPSAWARVVGPGKRPGPGMRWPRPPFHSALYCMAWPGGRRG